MDELYRTRLREFRLGRPSRTTYLDFSEDLDITPQHYAALEGGRRTPSIPLHVQICKTLDKPSDCFLHSGREDFALSPERIAYLKTLDTKQLKILLSFLQAVYEENQ